MKMRIIFSAIFVYMSFAVIANAQQGRLYVATDVGVYVPLVQSSSMSQLPVVSVTAGQPIRVQTGVKKDADLDIITGAGPGAQPHVKMTQIPCEDVPATSVRKAAGISLNFTKVMLRDVSSSATDAAWRNTCRLLTVELADGSKYRARIRFQ